MKFGENDFGIVKYLINHGADVNKADSDGITPLHLAVNTENLELVEFLVNHGADVDKADRKGITPLQLATQRGDQIVMAFLKSRKEMNDPVEDDDTETPINEISDAEE